MKTKNIIELEARKKIIAEEVIECSICGFANGHTFFFGKRCAHCNNLLQYDAFPGEEFEPMVLRENFGGLRS